MVRTFWVPAGLKIHEIHSLPQLTPTEGRLVTSGIAMTIKYRGDTLLSGGTAAQLPPQWPANRRMQDEYGYHLRYRSRAYQVLRMTVLVHAKVQEDGVGQR